MKAVVLHKEDDIQFTKTTDDEVPLEQAFHLRDNVPVPQPGDDEVLVKVMASALNYNTLWALSRRPVSTFDRLGRFAKLVPDAARHNLNYQIIGSDGAGIVVRKGRNVTSCNTGEHVVIHPVVFDSCSPSAMEDFLLDERSRIWGYETNFGSFSEYCVVKATQLLPKPTHLSWAEAAVITGSNATVYRMLISPHGARLALGEHILIWGGCGGIGSLAVQYALKAGGIPTAIVSSPEKAELVRSLGCSRVIVRSSEDNNFLNDDGTPNTRKLIRFRKQVLAVSDNRSPDIVFEHPGRSTFLGSVFVAAHGGRIITCGSTTGYMHSYDNRYLWMYGKSIIGSHCASWSEAAKANDLVRKGVIIPLVSSSFALSDFPAALNHIRSSHTGKIALLCNASSAEEGIEDMTLRNKIGLNRFRFFSTQMPHTC